MRAICLIFVLSLTLISATALLAQPEVGESAICLSIEERVAVGAGSEFRYDVGKLFCLTRVNGMTADSIVIHRWVHGETVMAEVELRVGGPSWRTWSSKNILPSWTGAWRVEILERGADVILKILEFTVSAPPAIEAEPVETEPVAADSAGPE